MSTGQIAAPNRSIPVSFAALAVAAAFAIGTLAGLGLPRVVDSANHNTGATGSAATVRTLPGVADNNMSDAAYPFLIGTGRAGSQAGVADNNMSDAAYPFLIGTGRAGSQAGVADNNMSDAAYPFLIGTGRAGSQAGVADNNMSDAAYPFLIGTGDE